MFQLSHPYMTTGKTIALTRRTFVGKVMSVLFNMLSRLYIKIYINNKDLLYSMGNYIQYLVITYNEKIGKKYRYVNNQITLLYT